VLEALALRLGERIAHGFRLVQEHRFLPYQYFLIFTVP
jgi:hypothetical protein